MLICPQCDDGKEKEIRQLHIYRFFLIIRLTVDGGGQPGGCGRQGRLPPCFILLVIILCFAQIRFPALVFNEEHIARG